MKVRTSIFVVIIVLVGSVFSQTTDIAAPDIPTDFGVYAKMSRADLEQSMEKIETARIAWENQILEVIRGKAPNQEKVAAIRLAAIYRLERLAPDLAAIITLKDERYVEVRHLARWGQFPALEALAEIGDQSLHPLLNNLAQSDDSEVRRLSGIAIEDIELGDTVARLILQDEIKRQADAKNDAAVVHLKAAMPLFDVPKRAE